MTVPREPHPETGPDGGLQAANASHSRGQPVRFLAIGLVCWLALRAATWQTDPFNVEPSLAGAQQFSLAERNRAVHRHAGRGHREEAAVTSRLVGSGADRGSVRFEPVPPWQAGLIAPLVRPPVAVVAPDRSNGPQRPSLAPLRSVSPSAPGTAPRQPLPLLASGHELLLMSSLGMVELPETMRPAIERATGAGQGAGFASPTGGGAEAGLAEPALPDADGPDAAKPVGAQQSRWSGDGWILLRESGAARGLVGSGPFFGARPGYGGSQAGAVLRYRLAPSSAHRPTVYVRAAAALRGPDRQREVATGLAVRPLAGLPVVVLGEARAALGPGGTRLRPAALLVSELPPQRLPFGAEAEIYAAAGYLAGKDATGFFDAQMVVDRRLVRLNERSDLRLGGGVWSGGQKGAYRVDIGPHAAMRFRLGAVGSRLAVDYRVRVAGQAQPGSGPAVTLSAGF